MTDKTKEKKIGQADPWVSKKVELRGIGFISTFKVFFGMTLVLSLIFMIAFRLFGIELAMQLAQAMFTLQGWIVKFQTTFPKLFSDPILSSLMFSIFSALITGIWIAISVAIFSLFAFMLGGVQLRLRERSGASVKKSFL